MTALTGADLASQRPDIQGLVLSSYSGLSCAAYFLLQIHVAAAARRWIAGLADQTSGEITTAEGKKDLSVNIAFTATGLDALGVPPDLLSRFSHAFVQGMASERRARILGDDGASAPVHWNWGGTPESRVDILLMVFTESPEELSSQITRRTADFETQGVRLVVDPIVAGRKRDDPDTREHFGFNDGIGQPVLEGSGNVERQRGRTGHATEIPPGEVLLGYLDAYGKPSPSPRATPGEDRRLVLGQPDGSSPSGTEGDFGLNGTYLVCRQIAQHVAAFWGFLDSATRGAPADSPDVAEQVLLAAQMVGRWPSGAPLNTKSPDDPYASEHDPAVPAKLTSENNFEFDNDREGFGCPIGAHIRRANPRASLNTDKKAALESVRRHRLLRRGRSYGERATDRYVEDGGERGLMFVCLNGDLERQFEFVQQTWINNRVFAGLNNEVDPVIGNQSQTERLMTIQRDPVRKRIHGLQSFVTVKGGAYFFLPGMRALRYLGALET